MLKTAVSTQINVFLMLFVNASFGFTRTILSNSNNCPNMKKSNVIFKYDPGIKVELEHIGCEMILCLPSDGD